MSGPPAVPPGDAGQPDRPPPQPYGSMPPPSPAAPAPMMAPPQTVQRASQALYASVAWSLLGLIVSIFTRDSTEDAIRDADTTLTDSQVESAATLGLVFAGIVAIGFGVLYIICARKMLEGKNWARITPTVLIGLGLLFGLLGLSAGSLGGLALVMQLVALAIGIAFLYFAWSRPSNEFFNSARIPR